MFLRAKKPSRVNMFSNGKPARLGTSTDINFVWSEGVFVIVQRRLEQDVRPCGQTRDDQSPAYTGSAAEIACPT